MGRGRRRKRHLARADLGEEEPAPFPVGAEVEVRRDDLGFVGSYYEATVTGYHPSCRGYVVAYSTLTRREDGGSPLREHAAADDVRPRPPAGAPPRRGFAVHEMVEAFHNEGWLAGVVCGAVPTEEVAPPAGDGEQRPRPRRLYTVCFPTSREVLEFEEAALRPRRVFRGDRWVPAAEAENGSPIFREGSKVEVSGSAKTFGEYWNPATVQKVIGATSLMVQYRHVREDGEPATEILDVQYIRPARTIICMDSKYRFPPSSHAEVFHEGSWWPGVILGVLDDKLIKKYVVKIKSRETDTDNVECLDVLTVEHTQLRPHCDWDRKKWVRHITKKPVNMGPPLTSRKRPISAALVSCNDNDEITASASCNSKKITALASCNDSNEIRDTTGPCLNKNVNNADVTLGPVCPDLLVCDENGKVQPKASSYPEEVVKKQNSVLALKSPTLPSQLSLTCFGHLKYDPKLCLRSTLQLASSSMISIPSVPQTGQFQASLVGASGQLRPLPQGPVLGIQPLNSNFGSIGEKALTNQENQSTDKGYYLMPGAEQNFNVGSFVGPDLSRKRRKECVSFQTLEREELETVMTRKRVVDKNVEETSNSVAISGESTKSNKDDNKELPNDANPGSGILSERNSLTYIDSTPLKGNKDSQEISVFLRESSVADEIMPSGVPIGTDKLHQGDYSWALQYGATEDSVLFENSLPSITSTLDNPGDVDVFPSGSSTQFGNKATNADKTARIMEQDIGGEFCQQSLVMADDANVGLLPSAESCEATGDGHQLCKGNMETVVEFPTSGVVPTENVSSMSLDMFSGVALNMLPSSENYEANKKDGMGKADHQGNTSLMIDTQNASADGPSSAVSLPALKGDIIVAQSSTILSGNEQHGVSQQDHSSPVIEYAAESGRSIQKSELIQLSSIDMSNSTEAEHGDMLIVPKDAEDSIPMSKYVPSRTHDSCRPLLQRSLDVHKGILADRSSESFAVENLPFMKTFPMWAQIEAMEILGKVPQRPNFHQFEQHVPELREGMALGLMLSFVSLAESIKRLSIHDESALFEEKMKGLSSLEAHGFDVRHLRSQMETLLHIKNGRAKLQDAMKKLEEKIAHKKIDDRQLGMQIGILNTSVRHLEVHTSIFRCMMQSAVSQKINHASEISRLKTEASELERLYLSAEQRFNSAITAPW